MRRLRLIILRPSLVFMRLRNPQVVWRFFLLGWYVRFIVFPFLRDFADHYNKCLGSNQFKKIFYKELLTCAEIQGLRIRLANLINILSYLGQHES